MRIPTLPCLLLALAACGTESDPPDADAGQPDLDSGVDGGGRDGGEPDLGAPDMGVPDGGVDAGVKPGCASDLSWTDGPPTVQALDHHMSFILTAERPYLFVAGGTNYRTIHAYVGRAAIGEDGTLGAWDRAGELPSRRSGSGVVTRDRFVALLAGRTIAGGGLEDLDEVVVATVADGGTLEGWRQMPTLPKPLFHLSASSDGARIFVSGGLYENRAESAVYVADFAEDGTISAWRDGPPMSRPRSHHSSWVQGGFLYVAGGLDGSPITGQHDALDSVERAPLTASGLGPWEAAGVQPQALATGAVAVHGRCAYHFAGLVNTQTQTDAIFAAEFGEEGRLGSWTRLPTPVPAARSHMHQVPRYGRHFYVVGGSVGLQTVTDAVSIGTLPPSP